MRQPIKKLSLSVRSLSISLASAETMRSWSSGEVSSAKTLKNDDHKPETNGLYDEDIFGPYPEPKDWHSWKSQFSHADVVDDADADSQTADSSQNDDHTNTEPDAGKPTIVDWKCSCGRVDEKDAWKICRKCNEPVRPSLANRDRMGHIELQYPVVHTWFLRGKPSILSYLLDLDTTPLLGIAHHKLFIVLAAGNSDFHRHQILSLTDYEAAMANLDFGAIEIDTGAEAIEKAIKQINLESEIDNSQREIKETKCRKRQRFLNHRISLLKNMRSSGFQPEPIVLRVLPVMPGGLRPLSPTTSSGNQIFINPDENDFYRRIIITNNKLKLAAKNNYATPEQILREIRSDLQGYVDALFANEFLPKRIFARRTTRPLKSLTSRLAGKDGTFRKTLLGKRVDFSARTVVTVGPHLKLHQCGLPLVVASKIFEPFLIRHLAGKGIKQRRSAKLWLARRETGKPNMYFECGDIFDLRAFAQRLSLKKNPLCSYLSKKLSRETLELYLDPKSNLPPEKRSFPPLLAELNQVISGASIYDKELFAGVKLNPEALRLVNKTGLQPGERIRLNRLLLDAAFPKDILQEAHDGDFRKTMETVMAGKVVLLNRQPTLHRLSIQAFEPVLVEGLAIRLHPLTCAAYNADFDGDQMVVHLPLSNEATDEARQLLFSVNNLISPGTGKPIVIPTQDIVLGCYYLTLEPKTSLSSQMKPLLVIAEAVYAYESRDLKVHQQIRIPNPDRNRNTMLGNSQEKILETTVGRVLFNEIWPPELGFYNRPVTKKDLEKLISGCIDLVGNEATAGVLDQLKDLGFSSATRAGISIGIADMHIPSQKFVLVEEARRQAAKSLPPLINGEPADRDSYGKLLRGIWDPCTEKIAQLAEKNLDDNAGSPGFNPLWLMLVSGARGKKEQVRQLIGLRGLIAKPDGSLELNPVVSNYREGLMALEYFTSCHGARKGIVEKSLQTADAGALTRQLADVGLPVVITEMDCGSTTGRWVKSWIEDGKETLSLHDRVLGRVLAEPVCDPQDDKKLLFAANTEIDKAVATLLQKAGVKRVCIRSPLHCVAARGICAKCYGWDLAKRRRVELGAPVGIIAAQSIGEPGTQMTLRTFHLGGIATGASNITAGIKDVTSLLKWPRKQAAPGNLESASQLADAIFSVYLHNEAAINEKHIEVIVRQLFSRVIIGHPGDTGLLAGQSMNRFQLNKINRQMISNGKQPAQAKPIVLGLTEMTFEADSFLSAAAFGKTDAVLREAALHSKDILIEGIKDCVMTGKLIPAGTGFTQ